ncbi:hypothetical protein Q648_00605 [Bartonella quintana JK 12]|uniref:Uncharacterized protein n=2 Tax=Bartonella quintana TaxID=803 RepID=W3TXC7_BARQI|nr:hypothetical protein Q651_01100 [Bartonella quintana BQ2-D70]ETS14383.1 hypothetical protein Q650_01019 [Bartonella quintana JK 73rel]ETS16070.1 hypothetical protein Q649_01028 [Bartonella quintana JK 73]ETS18072.1 hypothetical protein Q647_01016 [Bartonella quintana JK 7]ETS18901.1 hypothetical protein Q648_00605 [Bartonella quintana JK 12]KEC60110.1 hypothetical protein O93_00247 [Bartonella quintana JK 19]KEC60626.1 hypothetical protein O91_01217 [Bartonella quintana JK 31]KEC61711.1 h
MSANMDISMKKDLARKSVRKHFIHEVSCYIVCIREVK